MVSIYQQHYIFLNAKIFKGEPNSIMRWLLQPAKWSLDIDNKDEVIAAYLHITSVSLDSSKSRLLEWYPEDGWEPICHALNLPLPEVLFPALRSRMTSIL